MRSCYNCQNWDRENSYTKSGVCTKKNNVRREASDRICELFESIPCCTECRYLSGTICKLGKLGNRGNVYDLDDRVCDDYDPRKGSSSSGSSGGCYIATCVYGSYDCPPVWTLRRYRDSVLSERVCGRLFIKLYYAISPTLVKWFGKTKWFRRICKAPLDKLVSSLNDKGIDGTSYKDAQ